MAFLLDVQKEVEWKVEKFYDLPQKKGEKLPSPTFSVSNTRLYLEMYPNGDSREKSLGWISLFLMNAPTSEEHRVSFSLGIKKIDGSVFECRKCTEKVIVTGWGFSEFLKRSELSNVVTPDGAVTFFCTVRVLPDLVRLTKVTSSQTSSTKGVDNLSNNFKDLFISERLCDVKIKVGNEEFKAHKLVLVARSPVFSSMFEHEMAENSSGVVDIVDCEPESFKDFLLFLYTGKLNSVPISNVLGLYETAEKYDVKMLKVECCQRLTNELSVDLVCDVVRLAVVYKECDLLDTATRFFINNTRKIFTTEKWRAFMAENSSMAQELLIKMDNQNGVESITNK